eukprot:205591_1
MEEELALITHLPAFYQSILIKLYPLAGLPIDQINMVILLFFQTIVGSVFRRIKDTFIRRLTGMLLGFIIMYCMYGKKQSVFLLAFIICMYPIIKLKNVRISFWIGMISLFLSFFYIAYFYYLSWRLDFTTSMMGIVIRMHTLTWDMIDFDKIKNGENLGNFKRFVSFKQQHACDPLQISFFNYMAYMLFFIHILCGSNLTINEYLYITDRTIYKREGWNDCKNDPQPTYSQIFWGFSYVLITACVYLFGKIYFNFNFLMTKEFQQTYTFSQKFVFVPLSATLNKFKYHFGWKMLDLSLITSGAGFSGVEYYDDGISVKKIKWDRANNIWSLKTAFPQYTGHVVRYWNMTVNNWLTFYVFYRIQTVPKFLITLQGEKGGKILMTRIASAFYHGVYLNYYFFFFCTAIMTNILDSLRLILPTFEDQVDIKKKSQYALKSQMLFVFWVIMVVTPIDSIGIFFMELDVWKVISLFNSIYWFPFIIALIDFIIAQILLATIGIKQIEKDKRAKKYKQAKDSKKEK